MICRVQKTRLLITPWLSLLLLITLMPGAALAWSWQDLWKTPDQQLRELESNGDYAALLESEAPAWQGAGRYRNADYAGAAESYAESDSVSDHYNRGTALTKAGEFDAAIEAFDEVLSLQPEHESALHNRAIAEQLQALQQQQQQQNGENSEEGDSEQQDSESGQSDSESGDENQDQENQQSEQQQQDGGEQQSPDQEQQESDSEQQQSESEAQQAQSAQEQEQEQQQQQEQEAVSEQAQEPMSEDQQATEQWLRRIPDDPTGLLRRKLIRSHQIEYPDIRNSTSPW